MKKQLNVLLALVLFAGAQIAHAGSHTWSGTVSGLWSVAGNWSAGGVPASGESPLNLTFPVGGRSNTTNDVTGLQVDSLTLAGSGYTLYALAGRTLALKGTATNIISSGLNTIDASEALILSNTNFVSVATNTQLTIQSPISGNGSIGKVGPGQLNFTGTPANTYSGATFVLNGILQLQRGISVNSPALAVPGTLIIGNPAATNSSVSVNVTFPEQISDTSPLTVYNSAVLYINAVTETVGPLTLRYGNVNGFGQSALLKLTGDVTANGDAFGETIYCPLSLGGATRTFNIAGGSYDLAINSPIIDGGNNAGLIKTGNGGLRLAASNSYAGITLVTDGFLGISDAHALGLTNSGTVITNAGLLRFLGSCAVGAEPLVLASQPLYGNASLYEDFYTNSWAGPITLVSNTFLTILGSNSSLSLGGAISGPGSLTKLGMGTLTFTGPNANTYSGGTVVHDGTLVLNKSGVIAVPGALTIGKDAASTNTEIVQLVAPNQIADTAPVTITASGLLNMGWFGGASDIVGSLSGTGNVSLGLNGITAGGDNSDTTFAGTFAGLAASGFVKQGSGTLTLTGNSSAFLGTTTVNAGKLVVNSALGGALQMLASSSLGGTGVVGNVTATLGHIAPGNSVGKITTGNLNLNNSSSSLDVQVNGTTPGTGYDQLIANGSVSFSNPGLNIIMGFPGAISNKYVLVANDAADAVTGTFNGLPEGSTFTNSGVQFKISYHGGDGNDVELMQLSVIGSSSQINSINRLANGQIQLTGSGTAGISYSIEANTNIATTNWVSIGSVAADQNGTIGFTDPNAASFPMRFYRFKSQ